MKKTTIALALVLISATLASCTDEVMIPEEKTEIISEKEVDGNKKMTEVQKEIYRKIILEKDWEIDNGDDVINEEDTREVQKEDEDEKEIEEIKEIVESKVLGEDIELTISGNGENIEFLDIAPRMYSGQLYIPANSLFEHFGATVKTDRKGNLVINHRRNEYEISRDGLLMRNELKEFTMSNKDGFNIVEGKVFLSLDVISEIFNVTDKIENNNLLYVMDGLTENITYKDKAYYKAGETVIELPEGLDIVLITKNGIAGYGTKDSNKLYLETDDEKYSVYEIDTIGTN